MSSGKTAPSRTAEARLLTRVLDEAYGSGAWHGPDLKAALGDVAPEVAFWRPSPERHNLAEVAFHHTFCARSVRGQLSGTTPEPSLSKARIGSPCRDLRGSLGRKFTQPWKG